MEIPKPTITFAGTETQLPLQLKERIERELPQEGLKWQRPYRRQPKTVYLEAKFEHYTENFQTSTGLIERQLLHTFWIECYDVDIYKQQFRENLINWVNKFSKYDHSEWLIVLIDNTEKKSNKTKLLPRSSVSDKIKADFPIAIKNLSDKHIVHLFDPLKKDPKALESFVQFLQKLRKLLLTSYSKQLTNYEDYIRSQREQRNNENWDFLAFFLAQEELAFAFELLGLYDDALVQYDELDALFSQFIKNINLFTMPFWLKNLVNNTISWHGLCLSNQVSFDLREKLKNLKGSFLDLRNYLFARQCELLLLQHMPWQVANRSLSFLQNCVNEMKALEINLLPGAIDCWVFLSASEILLICERYNDSSQMDSFSKNTIGVRAYSRRKLEELGKICGLFPGAQSKTNTDYLHYVVTLIAGMGDDYHLGTSSASSQSRLKEALSSSETFLKNFLEFSELTMGTYKHIGRMREARLIGKELAKIYMQLNKFPLALSFLLDLEKVFLVEQWLILLADIQKNILVCYEKLNDVKKQIVYCFYLSSSEVLSIDEQKDYMEKLNFLIKTVKVDEEPMKIKMLNIIVLESIKIVSENKNFITNFVINLNIKLRNNLADDLLVKKLFFTMTLSNKEKKDNFNHLKNNEICVDLKKSKVYDKPFFDSYQESSVGIICKNNEKVFKRLDSQNIFKDPVLNESSFKFMKEDVCLKHGLNDLNLTFNTETNGIYSLKQFCIFIEPNIYIINNDFKSYTFEIINQKPSLELLIKNKNECEELVAGVIQKISFVLNSGSNYFAEKTVFKFNSSEDLLMKLSSNEDDKLVNCIKFELPYQIKPFEKYEFEFNVFCKLEQQNTNEPFSKKINLYIENSMEELICPVLNFIPLFYTTMTLHTCSLKKFVQISLISNTQLNFNFEDLEIDCLLENKEELKDILECKYLTKKSVNTLQSKQTLHFMWEILIKKSEISNLKLGFSLKYNLNFTNLNDENVVINQKEIFDYKCHFSLKEFTTLYTVRINVNPQTGSEFCRAGNLCNLCVKIKKNSNLNTEKTAIMYELVTDKTLWAINGKTAGVLEDKDCEDYELNFEVLPLISGFLPLPSIRLSKYVKENDIEQKNDDKTNLQNANVKLIAFDSGQIYNYSRGVQVNVLSSSGLINTD